MFDFWNNMMNPMIFMQRAFFMQLQLMQNMTAMQLQLMQNMMNGMNFDMSGEGAGDTQTPSVSDGQEGFKLGNITVPPELLRKLMKMEMSPENLGKLQKLLDTVLGAIPVPGES